MVILIDLNGDGSKDVLITKVIFFIPEPAKRGRGI